MRRESILFLLLAASCSVPNLDELNSDCDKKPDLTRLFETGPADAMLGGGSGCRVVTTSTALIGFTPGCVQFRAVDAASGKEFIAELTDLRARGVRDLRVAFLPPDSWAPDLTVEVRSFEQRCDGVQIGLFYQGVTALAGQVVPVSMALDGRDADNDGFVARTFGGSDCRDDSSAVFPGAPELCNGQDDNCDGIEDESEFDLGAACTASNGCMGVFQCDPEGLARVCHASPSGQRVYLDADRDGYGAGTGTIMCGTPPTGYVLNNQDCDDTASNVHPGATEWCDGRDNNCDNIRDEGYPNLGSVCLDANSQCGGTYQCSTEQNSTVCVASGSC
ncbi:putative metal-binding motif-containing protein [Myxococcus fulvus]|uniref:putative metal-binding motif-containing protein n=1 Tax=Myxococcus fulvus TaxID=33 RepID=UPI003B9CA2AE